MKKAISVWLLSLTVAGCATSSGVTPLGVDTYLISRNGAGFWSSTAQIKAEALKDANAYCAENRKTMQIVHTSQHEASGRPGDFPGAEIQFMCLNANDSELNRPKPHKEADIKIESNIRDRKEIKMQSTGDMYEELKKLKELLDSGIITQSEFDMQKTKILNK